MARTRERRLLGATALCGVLVLFSHAGGPLSCAPRQVDIRDASHLYNRAASEWPGIDTGLVLTRPSHHETKDLATGTLIEINGTVTGVLVGFDPKTRDVFISPDGEKVVPVRGSDIEVIVVLGERRWPSYTGNGALIGGLTGAVAGATIGATTAPGGYETTCAFNYGAAGAAVGTGVGATAGGIGGAAAGRPRTEYVIGPDDWHLGGTPTAATK